MNQHGETFEDQPPAGEYWLCPLYGCKYKLLFALPFDLTQNLGRVGPLWTVGSVATWYGGDMRGAGLLRAYVQAGLEGHVAGRERRMQEHLKTHELIDFYRTRVEIFEEAQEKMAKIMRLADQAFVSTASQERPEGGE